MPTKRLVSKRARRSPPPPVSEPNFSNEAHKTRYALLSRKQFGTIRRIEWETLRILGLQNTVREYISHGGWDRVFEIEEPTFKELTLEVLSTIEVTDHCPFTHQTSSISFRAFGKKHRFPQDQLGVYLGLYTEEFARTPECKGLPRDFPHPVTHNSFWRSLGGSNSKKASQMSNPAYRYIQALLSRSIGGRSDSTGVVTRTDLLMLYSIVERYPIHLGHLFATLIAHQGISIRLGSIFVGPYITRMIRGLGLIELTRGMKVVGSIAPLGMPTLLSIGMVRKSGTTYRLKQHEGRSARDPGPSHDTETGSDSESKSAPAPEPEPKGSLASLEASFAEFRIEVSQQLQTLERGQRELAASQSRIESSVAEVLSYLRCSASSVGTSSAATTHTASSLPPAP